MDDLNYISVRRIIKAYLKKVDRIDLLDDIFQEYYLHKLKNKKSKQLVYQFVIDQLRKISGKKIKSKYPNKIRINNPKNIEYIKNMHSDYDIMEIITKNEKLEFVINNLKLLTNREYDILIYYLNGYKQFEIGDIYGLHESSISYILDDIILKIKSQLNYGERRENKQK